MKKLIFASAAVLIAFISTQAQTNDAITANDNNKLSKTEKKEIWKEKKEEQAMQKNQHGGNVSYQAKQEFFREYGDHPEAQWSRSANFDEAIFTRDGIQTKAYYDTNSELVGTTCLKTFEDLPAYGQKQLRKQFKDYTVTGVVFFDDNENNDTNMILYSTAFDDADNYFVELKKDDKTIVAQVTMDGLVDYFTELK